MKHQDDQKQQAMPPAIFCAARTHQLNDSQHVITMRTKVVLAPGVEIDNHRENNLLLLDSPLQLNKHFSYLPCFVRTSP